MQKHLLKFLARVPSFSDCLHNLLGRLCWPGPLILSLLTNGRPRKGDCVLILDLTSSNPLSRMSMTSVYPQPPLEYVKHHIARGDTLASMPSRPLRCPRPHAPPQRTHSAIRITTNTTTSTNNNMAPSTTTTANNVWLITGCSSGFGRELALAARKRGDLVIATARKIETLKGLQELGCDALSLDVTADDATVNDTVAKAHAVYGRIDILVNNAGYTSNGAVEEASSEETQQIFDTNVFGLLRVTRAVLPYMREKKSGTIANIGSLAGYASYPACGLYCATKFAVAGVTQALRQEVAGFGIDVTVVEPGLFQTNLIGAGQFFKKSIPDYAPLIEFFKNIVENGNGGVPASDPAKGAQAIVEALTHSGRGENRTLPNRLPLGGDVRDLMQNVLTTGQKELDDWKDFTDPKAFAFEA